MIRPDSAIIRMKYLEAILYTQGKITGEHYRKVFNLGTAATTRDFAKYRNEHQPCFFWDPKSRAHYVTREDVTWHEEWYSQGTPEEYIAAIHLIYGVTDD